MLINTKIKQLTILAAPQEGAANDFNTGITWGSGGSIATRFSDVNCADSEDEVLVDNLTDLMWTKLASTESYTWENTTTAPALANNYCGFTDVEHHY